MLADGIKLEELDSDSDYENDILKNNENKNNGDHSRPDKQDDISLNTRIQEKQINLMLLAKFHNILE